MTIRELLGVPERTLLSFIKSAYKLGINPLPLLRIGNSVVIPAIRSTAQNIADVLASKAVLKK